MNGNIFHERYEILDKLGSGGTSVVFKAKDLLLNRLVTIKILREQFASDQSFVQQFKQEAQSVACLSHPNIVSIYDVVFTESSHYLVMEYVEGCSLKEYINQHGALDIELATRIEMQILDALQHAHEHQLVHRDIKPHNILLDPDMQVKVTDFGIAMAVSDATQNYTTDIVGSVHYMAPEQVEGSSASAQTDLYSAAVVFYELLTGSVPFGGDNAMGIAMQHVQSEIEPPHKLNKNIPIELSAIIMRALRKNPSLRYSSAREMATAISKVDIAAPSAVADGFNWNTMQQEPSTQANQKTPKNKEQNKNTGKKQWNKKNVAIAAGIAVVALIAILVLVSSLIGGRNNEVSVPRLIGMDYREAQTQLTALNLVSTIERVTDAKALPDTVLDQSVPVGQNVKEGREIILTVCDGKPQDTVPQVTGLTQREAKIILENSGFRVVINEVINQQAAAGIVIEQTPAADTPAQAGATITLDVSKGSEISMPDLKGQTLDQAKALLAQSNLVVGEVTKAESATVPEGSVINQSIKAASKILEGNAIDLVISQGPGALAGKARVSYTVPLTGEASHVVKIVVNDAKGSHEEYNVTHVAGDEIVKDVPFYGKGKINIFLDSENVFSQDVGTDSAAE